MILELDSHCQSSENFILCQINDENLTHLYIFIIIEEICHFQYVTIFDSKSIIGTPGYKKQK